MSERPVLFVLAGVNGAGKSSIGGHLLRRAGLDWFDPDQFARDSVAARGCDQADANRIAWEESRTRLDAAIAAGRHHAFETTLGGRTMAERILGATRSHDVLIWFCGLNSPEQHIARVAAGGHAIPEQRIRERYPRALENLLSLMPRLAALQVYDNSREAAPGGGVPDPQRLLEMRDGRLLWPLATDIERLAATPDWAKPLLAAALCWHQD